MDFSQGIKSIVDAIFVLRQLQEKFGAKKRDFPCLCSFRKGF